MNPGQPDLHRVLQFMALLHEFQKVERRIYVPGLGKRAENDAEHSYSLTMLAWYLCASLNLPLDKDKMIRYALAHDFIEVYAGDTPVFTKDETHRNTKNEREHAAQVRIENEFPEFPELHEVIKSYEQRSDDESIFVWTLDKIVPVLTNYIQGGDQWRDDGVTLQQLLDNKYPKVAHHPVIQNLFAHIEPLLRTHEHKLFHKP